MWQYERYSEGGKFPLSIQVMTFEIPSVHRNILPRGLHINKSFSLLHHRPPPRKRIILRYLAIVRLPCANIPKGRSHVSKTKGVLRDRKLVLKGLAHIFILRASSPFNSSFFVQFVFHNIYSFGNYCF